MSDECNWNENKHHGKPCPTHDHEEEQASKLLGVDLTADRNFLERIGKKQKNTNFGRAESLDEYYERTKDNLDKKYIQYAFKLTPGETDRYTRLKQKEEQRLREAEKKNGYKSKKSYIKPEEFKEKYKEGYRIEEFGEGLAVSDKKTNKHIATYKPKTHELIEFEPLEEE